jgi:hypothetical protein
MPPHKSHRLPALLAALTCLAGGMILGSRALAEEAEAPVNPLSAEQARVQKMVDDLRPIVAEMRGLPWKAPVPARVISRKDLRAYLLKEIDKDVTPEEWKRDDRITKRLGLLKPTEDLRALVMLMYEAGIAGFYDPSTGKLFVVAGFKGEGQIPTMVHELIHALEDQHLDLEKLEEPYRKDDPDRQFTLRCLFEGSAEYGRRRYQDLQPDVARAYYEQVASQEDTQKGQMRMMKQVPTHMLLATLLHYRMGPNFVAHAIGSDYAGGIQRLLEDPPTTQEQVLHPYKWLGTERDYPRTVVWGGDIVAAAGEGWKKMDEHSVGELDLALYLDYFLGDKDGRLDLESMGAGTFVNATSSRAARGWDAGRALYLESPDGHITIVQALAFDTVEDAVGASRYLGAALHRANAGSWKGQGWKSDKNGGPRRYDYVGKHGLGRIEQSGRSVLLLDGFAPEGFEQLWDVVAKTTFVKDRRDKGDDAADPFAHCTVVDARRGLGLKLPNAEWKAVSSARSPISFANAQKGAVHVDFLVIDQEVSNAGLANMGRSILGGAFKEERAKPAAVMGQKGLVHPMQASPGLQSWLYLASDAARTYVIVTRGPTADLAAARSDLDMLLKGMPGPRGGAAGTTVHAGLRSIPGY